MLRFGSIALGVLFTAFGAYMRWIEPPVSAVPAATTLDDVVHLAVDEPRFVDFPGTVDMGGKLYRTGIAAPAYSSCDPRVVYPLAGDWTKLLGCTVVLTVPPEETVATVTGSRSDLDLPPAEALRRRTILAPVRAAGPGLWVLSPAFLHHREAEDPSDAGYRTDFGQGPFFRMADVTAEEERWVRRPDLSGPLAQWSDLPRNRRDFEEGAFAEGLRLAMGGLDPGYVVLADGRRPIEEPVDPAFPRAIAPVDSAPGLYVALDWDAEPPRDGRIAGMLEELEKDAMLWVIRLTTPEEINEDNAETANFSMWLGGALVAFGMVLVALERVLAGAGREVRRARR